jgi:hypothetical protein
MGFDVVQGCTVLNAMLQDFDRGVTAQHTAVNRYFPVAVIYHFTSHVQRFFTNVCWVMVDKFKTFP